MKHLTFVQQNYTVTYGLVLTQPQAMTLAQQKCTVICPRTQKNYTVILWPRAPKNYTVILWPRAPQNYTVTLWPRTPQNYTVTL